MTHDDFRRTRENVLDDIRLSLHALEAIAERVTFLDWEPRFKACGDGFLFHWEPTDPSPYVTPKRFVSPYADEKIVIDVMIAAALEGAEHFARINFRVRPKGV